MSSLDAMRRLAVRGLFAPRSLADTLDELGFVQADPIRAPARAQDLTLRPRVVGYRDGDLDRHYAALPLEEDVFINYGFVTRAVQSLMHPRVGAALLPTANNKHARAILDFIRERGAAHPREVDERFDRGRVVNYWGGTSSATTHLLENMHYKGLLRVVRREAGIRVYGVQQHGPAAVGAGERRARLDALVDTLVRKYAPIPARGLSILNRLRYAVPQWQGDLPAAIARARQRLPRVEAGGTTWFMAPGQSLTVDESPDEVRLVAPFDPVVWDRHRFEVLFGWAYRFEAYTPVKKRKLGYYALPLLWRDRVIGWANLTRLAGPTVNRERRPSTAVAVEIGYVKSAPRDRNFRRELDAEIERLQTFLRT